MTSINTNYMSWRTDWHSKFFFPSSSALIPVCTILSLALLYMLTHDKRRVHKLKPVFKIKSLYNEKRLPQVPVSFCKKCLRNVSLAVSPHYIFFVIGNTNRRRIPRVWKLVVIASRRKNIGKTTLYNSNYITRRSSSPFWTFSCREPAIRTTGNPLAAERGRGCC